MVRSDVSSKKMTCMSWTWLFRTCQILVSQKLPFRCLGENIYLPSEDNLPSKVLYVCASVQTLNCKYPSVYADIGNKNASLFEFCTAGSCSNIILAGIRRNGETQKAAGWRCAHWSESVSHLLLSPPIAYTYIYMCLGALRLHPRVGEKWLNINGAALSSDAAAAAATSNTYLNLYLIAVQREKTRRRMPAIYVHQL